MVTDLAKLWGIPISDILEMEQRYKLYKGNYSDEVTTELFDHFMEKFNINFPLANLILFARVQQLHYCIQEKY